MKIWGVLIAFSLQNEDYIHSPNRIENRSGSRLKWCQWIWQEGGTVFHDVQQHLWDLEEDWGCGGEGQTNKDKQAQILTKDNRIVHLTERAGSSTFLEIRDDVMRR